MKYIFFIAVLFSESVFGQINKIKITKEKFYNTIVTEVKNKKKKTIYDKTIKWINLNYQDPTKVILSKIDNEFIRIQGISDLYWVQYPEPRTDYFAYPVKYIIDISIKDNKYQFKIQNLQTKLDYTFTDFNILSNPEFYYRKDGTFIESQKPTEEELPKYFNSLNQSLYNYILEKKDVSENW